MGQQQQSRLADLKLYASEQKQESQVLRKPGAGDGGAKCFKN